MREAVLSQENLIGVPILSLSRELDEGSLQLPVQETAKTTELPKYESEVVELLPSDPPLDEKLKEGTQLALKFTQEDCDFLEKEHPLSEYLQKVVEAMGDPDCPPTRVLVAVNTKEPNAFSLADGTIVINQALINKLDHVEELIAVIAHEQVHFEKKHHQKQAEDWYQENRDVSQLSEIERIQSWLGSLAHGRAHEYQADLVLTAKLDKLGIDTMIFKDAIRKTGVASKENESDFEHGTALDRAINTVELHALVDFEASDSESSDLHLIPKEWKLQHSYSRMEKLSQLIREKDFLVERHQDWQEVLEQAGPLVFKAYLRKLINFCIAPGWDIKRGLVPETMQGKLIIREQLSRLQDAQLLVKERLRGSSLDDEEQRLAYILFFSNGLGFNFSDWDDVVSRYITGPSRKKLAESIDINDQIKISDYSPTTFAKLSKLHEEGGIYQLAGINQPEINKYLNLYNNVTADLLAPVNLKNKLKEDLKPGEMSLDYFINYLLRMKEIIELKYEDKDIAHRWLMFQLKNYIRSYVKERVLLFNLNYEQATDEIVEQLSLVAEKHQLDFSYHELNSFANSSVSHLLFGERKSRVREKTLDKYTKALFQSEPEFIEAIENEDEQYLLQLASENPKKFLRQLSILAAKKENKQTVVDLVSSVLSKNTELMGTDFVYELSDEQRERLSIINLSIDEENKEAIKDPSFLQLVFAIEALCAATAGNNLQIRQETFHSYFANEKIKEKLKTLSLIQLDWLSQFIASETSLVNILVKKNGYLVERRHDLPTLDLKDSFEDYLVKSSDDLLELGPLQELKQKLIDSTNEADRETIQNHYCYYLNFFKQMYRVKDRDIWGSSLKMSEAIAPLTTKFLKILEEEFLNNQDNGEILMEVLTAIQSYLPQNKETRHLVELLVKQILKVLPFNEAVTFLSREVNRGSISLAVINDFIENNLYSREQFSQCRGALVRVIDQTVSNPPKEVGEAVFFDTVFDYYSDRFKMTKILSKMLSSKTGDSELREELADDWWYGCVSGAVNSPMIAGYDFETEDNQVKIIGPNPTQFMTFETAMDDLYQINMLQKKVLLRKLFLARHGIFSNKDAHQATIEAITKEIKDDATLKPLINKIFAATLASSDPLMTFNALANAISPMLLKKPDAEVDNSKAIKKINGLAKNGFYDARVDNSKYSFNRNNIAHLLSLTNENVAQEALSKQATTRIINGAYQNLISTINQELDLETDEERAEDEPLKTESGSPIEIILKVASAMGPVGVRFLQVLNQYIEVDSQYEESFREVFDSMPGQSKYTAFSTLERLGKSDELVKNFLENELVSIDQKIGGGSIFTAFKTTVKDQEGNLRPEVLKVKNPNAERWVREMIKQAKRIVIDLKERDSKNRANYEVADRLLDTIEQWVLDDIADPNFLEDDRLFAQLNEGFTASNGLAIHVAKGREPNNRWLKREPFVEGPTLNQLMNQDDENSRKILREAVEAEAENLANQLSQTVEINGQEYYLVHSDIHPGNIIISSNENQKVTLNPIDRNFYLRLTKKDVDFVKFVLKDSQDKRKKLTGLVKYFLQLEENKDLGLDTEEVVKQIYLSLFKSKIREVFNGRKKESSLQLMNKILQELDKSQVKISLNIRIMMKNLDSVNRLLKDTDNGTLSDYL